MERVGRPRKPAPAVVLKILQRLLAGPFWVGDWKSTRIGSYGTVNNTMQYLHSVGLLTRERKGHKILYGLKQPIPFPEEEVKWVSKSALEKYWPKYSISDWLPYLTTKRDMKTLLKKESKTPEWVIELLDKLHPRIHSLGVYGRLGKEDKMELEIELTNKEIIELLEKVKPDFDQVQYVAGWEKCKNFQVCLNCLKDNEEYVETRFDKETGETVCPKCGLVIQEDPIQRGYDSRPSPFPPPIDEGAA